MSIDTSEAVRVAVETQTVENASNTNSKQKTKINQSIVFSTAIFVAILVPLVTWWILEGTSPPRIKHVETCDIFCTGPILSTMQASGFFTDSKTFVDMPMKCPPEQVIRNFRSLPDLNVTTLAVFLQKNFAKVGSDLENWRPNDFTSEISLFSAINDTRYRSFAKSLNELWLTLGKRISADVYANPTRHTLLPLLHPFIVVPGGRFREFYYWDSYWIVRGLLLCEMTETARYVIENLANFVSIYGFIPNGSRAYYLKRTQPPFFAYMVDAYFQKTKDIPWLARMLPLVDKEYKFFMTVGKRAIQIHRNSSTFQNGTVYTLNRYFTASEVPRPESYVEDQHTANVARKAHGLPAISDAPIIRKLFAEISAGAESGWDFSSRWLADRKNLATSITSDIIPVDLNAIMCGVEKILQKLHHLLAITSWSQYVDHDSLANEYENASKRRVEAIENVLWSSKTNQWHDYNWKTDQHYEDSNYLSNYLPLWTMSFPESKNTSSIIHTLLQSNLLMDGGMVTSLKNTGEQWDYPNSWAPLQHMIIEGISHSEYYPPPNSSLGYDDIIQSLPILFSTINSSLHFAYQNPATLPAQVLAFYLASRWLYNNFLTFNSTGMMWEKYYAPMVNTPGFKGEYIVQSGFGWTNGVALIFLEKYGDMLNVDFTKVFPPPFRGMETPVRGTTAQTSSLYPVHLSINDTIVNGKVLDAVDLSRAEGLNHLRNRESLVNEERDRVILERLDQRNRG